MNMMKSRHTGPLEYVESRCGGFLRCLKDELAAYESAGTVLLTQKNRPR